MSEFRLEKKRRLGYTNSPETRRRIGLATKGRVSPWKGGKSFEEYSVKWTETLKRSIKERDRYVCRICMSLGGN